MGGANVVLSPRGGRAIAQIGGKDITGALGLEIRGASLPALRLAVSTYRYRQDNGRTIADADAEYDAALDYGSFRGIRASGSGKLQMDGERIVFAAPACTNVSLTALSTSRTDQFRDVKGQICGTALRVTGGEAALDLSGCADVSFSSLLNNASAIVNDAKGKLCGTTGRPLFVSKVAGWQVDGRWSDASLRLVSAETVLGEATGRVQLSGTGGEIRSGDVIIDSARLSDLAREARFRPISASGALRALGSDWQGNFILSAANRRLATVALRHSLANGAGEAAVEARELAFAPNQFQPADVAPFLSTFGSRVRGRADFSGRIGWAKDGFTSEGRLQLAGVDFQSRIGMVRQLNTDLAFSSLMPFALRPNQSMTMSRIELFVPLEQVSARFTYTPEALRLEAATASVADGTVSLDPMNYLLAPGSTSVGTIRLKNINATPLVAAAGLADRMNVSAHIDGVVPFTFGPNGVRFTNGHVAANAPGRLSIKRSALTSSVGVGEAGKAPPNAVQDFAYQALENLSFDQLDGTVNSLPMGRLGLLLHVKGRNDPAQTPQETRIGVVDLIRGRGFDKPLPLPKGTPIDLTLDTSLNLDELLNSYFNRVGSAAQEAMN